MSYVNPAFDSFPHEEVIIGRMMLAFGELEYLMVTIAGTVNGDLAAIIKALYRLRSTSSRLDAADALIRPFMTEMGTDGDYGVALGALRYCHTIRNTYAHCNWAGHSDAGLFYADLEDAAQGSIYKPYKWLHIDMPVLERLESFYENTHDWMLFIHSEAIFLKGFGDHNPVAKPRALARPILHNPPETHARPWTHEDRTERHARLAREAEKAFHLSQQKHDPEKSPPPAGDG